MACGKLIVTALVSNYNCSGRGTPTALRQNARLL